MFSLVPMLQRGNPYGMHSHAGAWERDNTAIGTHLMFHPMDERDQSEYCVIKLRISAGYNL